jgi:hypothetical protein
MCTKHCQDMHRYWSLEMFSSQSYRNHWLCLQSAAFNVISCHVSVSPTVQGESKVKLTLKQALKDQMGRYTSTLSLTFDTRLGAWGGGGQRQATLPMRMTPYPLYTRLVWYLGWLGNGEKNLVPTGIRSLEHPARNE